MKSLRDHLNYYLAMIGIQLPKKKEKVNIEELWPAMTEKELRDIKKRPYHIGLDEASGTDYTAYSSTAFGKQKGRVVRIENGRIKEDRPMDDDEKEALDRGMGKLNEGLERMGKGLEQMGKDMDKSFSDMGDIFDSAFGLKNKSTKTKMKKK